MKMKIMKIMKMKFMKMIKMMEMKMNKMMMKFGDDVMMMTILWWKLNQSWKLSSEESYLVMKVI